MKTTVHKIPVSKVSGKSFKSLYFIFLVLIYIAQSSVLWAQSSEYLSKEAVSNLVYKKFGTLVTGQNTSTGITNYAAVDPVKGVVSLNGAFSIHAKQDQTRISFMSFKFSGDLLSNNSSVLFTNSKLNTNAGIELQYNYGLKQGISYNYTGSNEAKIFRERKNIVYQKQVDSLANRIDKVELRRTAKYLEINRSLLIHDKDSIEVLISSSQKSIEDMDVLLRYTLDKKEIQRLQTDQKKVSEKIMRYDSLVNKLEKSIFKHQYKVDSIQQILDIKNTSNYQRLINYKIDAEYKKKIDRIDSMATVENLRFSWISFTGGASRKKYYIFAGEKPFAQQLASQDFYTRKMGIAMNWYIDQSIPYQLMLYTNLGIQLEKDNNTLLLNTTEIVQEREIENATGDTTRTITKKYNAYTDSIVESNMLSAYANFYWIHPSQKIALHVYPSIYSYSLEKAYANLGFGFLTTFKAASTDRPIVNAEFYVHFIDLTNVDNRVSGKKWGNNEIGIRLSHPFYFFK